MLKRIILSGALALLGSLHQASYADDAPAWGLIVKLKSNATDQSPRSAYDSNSRAQASAADMRAEPSAMAADVRMQSTLLRAGMPRTSHRALLDTALHHVGTDQILSHSQAKELANQLMASGEVEWAIPNERAHLQQVAVSPDDYFFRSGDQWWAQTAGGSDTDPAPQKLRGTPNLANAWSVSTGSTATIVAVLDTGLISHADLDSARIMPGRNFHHSINLASGGMSASLDQDVNNATDPGDYLTQTEKDASPTAYQNCTVSGSSWHGTAVAGIVAATANNNTVGIAGANWNTRILPLRVAGKCGAWESDILDALNWVAGDSNGSVKRADVVNLSFGNDGSCDAAYLSIIRKLKQRGVVVVASAGNKNGLVSSPANCTAQPGTENLISVAALTRDGLKTPYSNFGAEITLATVGGDSTGAPGGSNVCSPTSGFDGECGVLTLVNSGTTTAIPNGSIYVFGSGTSFSAPIAAATAALVWGVNAGLTADQVVSTLKISARPHQTSSGLPNCSAGSSGSCTCTTQTCGTGILDAYKALLVARNNPPAAITGPPENKGGGGGGGSLSLMALLGLAFATSLIARQVKAQVPHTA